jgi:hypothetical protein
MSKRLTFHFQVSFLRVFLMHARIHLASNGGNPFGGLGGLQMRSDEREVRRATALLFSCSATL